MTDWLRNAIDVHVHPSPSMYPRLMDDDELARQAEAAGMRAVLLKCHEGYTMERATLAQKRVKKLSVLGGCVLNHFVGGLNPHAVGYALIMGARMIWMPTMHSANHLKFRGGAKFAGRTSGLEDMPVEGLTVLDEKGKLKPAVHDILDLMKGKDCALGSGHLHWTEIDVLFREAVKRGITRCIITHAESVMKGCTVEFQVEMARLGVYIERCYLAHHAKRITMEKAAGEIRQIGVDQVVLETDFGQNTNPKPTEGLIAFCEGLHGQDFSETDIRKMASLNPARLLNLPIG
jgi:hypothetical protein